jgi:hypothetical protein
MFDFNSQLITFLSSANVWNFCLTHLLLTLAMNEKVNNALNDTITGMNILNSLLN